VLAAAHNIVVVFMFGPVSDKRLPIALAESAAM
jgi:hypothetical protein